MYADDIHVSFRRADLFEWENVFLHHLGILNCCQISEFVESATSNLSNFICPIDVYKKKCF